MPAGHSARNEAPGRVSRRPVRSSPALAHAMLAARAQASVIARPLDSSSEYANYGGYVRRHALSGRRVVVSPGVRASVDLDEPEIRNALSRRQIVKKIGAVTALAWSVPVLSSVRASAQTQGYGRCPSPECSCTTPPNCTPSQFECFCFPTVAAGCQCLATPFQCGSPCSEANPTCPSGTVCTACAGPEPCCISLC
jgi:hypothetical protein